MHALAIPKWGIEMENGTITHWHRQLGEEVTKGDELVDIESDKIVNTLEATASGVLKRKLVEEDATLGVGELIGVIAEANTSEAEIDAFIEEFNSALKSSEVGGSLDQVSDLATKPNAPQAVVASADTPTKVRVSPPVKRKAKQLGVDISTVLGSGPNGRITSDDIDRAATNTSIGGSESVDNKVAAPVASDEQFTSSTLSPTQQTIARRLTESKQSVPHFYLSTDIELDALLAKRADINSQTDQKVSINDMLVWCTARALQAVPKINAQFINDELRQFANANISVAVSTERGLFTPVVKAAEAMTPVEISSAISQLIDKANNGNLQGDDIQGGSFTVSNLGMYGVTGFEAIINPPQVAILALGQAHKQVVVRDENKTQVATIMSASLSCDHRVVDGALGGTFLSTLRQEIESLG